MATTLDQLEIHLTADISKAENAINKLSKNLTALESQLRAMNASNLSAIGQAVSNLGDGMQKLKGMGEKHFESLAKSINKLNSVNSSGLTKTAFALTQLSNAFSSAQGVGQNASDIASMADAIRKFGYSTVPQAITNMPLLANALKQMMQTLSTSPQVSQNLIQMTNALANLASASKGVQYQTAPSINKGFTSIKKGAHKLINVLKKLGNHLKKNETSFKSFAFYMGKFYANYAFVIRAIKGLGRSITSGMDYVETYNYFSVAFSKIRDELKKQGVESANDYADGLYGRLKELNQKMTGYSLGDNGELIKSGTIGLGLDANQLMNYQARIMAVTNSVGLLGQTSVDTSEGLSMLASDLSSLTNTDLEDVMSNLQSGLIGQSRALYKFGIDITSATLGEYALANGITKSVSAMSQSEKMQLRMLAILDQSRVSWGDQANTINSVANQYRIFGQQITNLSRILGNLFLPIVQKVLPVVNGLVIALQELFTFLGFQIFGSDWLAGILDGISGGYGGEIEDLGEDAEDASDAVGKLNKNLQSFDKLNVLSSSSGSSSSGGSSFDLSGAISNMLGKYQEAWTKALSNSQNLADKYAGIFKSAFKPIYDIIDELKNGAFTTAGKTLADSIANGFKSINWDNIFAGSSDFGTKLARFMNGAVSPDLFSEVGKTIANSIKSAVLAGLSFTNTFNWSQLGTSIAEGINGFTKNYPWKEMITLAGDLGTGIADALNSFIEDINVTDLGNLLWGKVKAIINFAFNFTERFDFKAFSSKVKEFAQGFVQMMDTEEYVKGHGRINQWQKIGITIGNSINGIIELIKTIPWTEIAGGIADALYEAYETIKKEHPLFAITAECFAIAGTLFKSALFMKNLATAIGGGATAGSVGNGVTGILIPMALIDASIIKHNENKDVIDTIQHSDLGVTSTHASSSGNTHGGGGTGEFTSIIKGITKVLEEESYKQKGIVSDLTTSVSGSLDNLSKKNSDTTTSMSKNVNDLNKSVYTDVDTIIKNFKDSATSIQGIGEKDFPIATSTFTKEVSDMNTDISKFLSDTEKSVSSTFSEEVWTSDGVVKGLGKTFSNAVSKIKEIWNPFADELNNKLQIDVTSSSSGGILSGLGVGISSISIGKVGKFSGGGFPEDGLFLANHNELVGGFSNGKTAVANNEQIVEGIKRGVKEALMESNGNTTVVLEGDAKGLFKAVRKEANAYYNKNGQSAFSY